MTSLAKKRVVVLIDGYNLYHAIDRLEKPHLKWLNLRMLSDLLMRSDKDAEVVSVHYFSAYAEWLPESYARHRQYVKALQSVGISIHLGNFKQKERSCRKCNAQWMAHEEKESDVNIAINLIKMCYEDAFDKLVLITADTDLAPALRMAKIICPEKHFTIAFPPPGRKKVSSLIDATDTKLRISEDMIQRSLFTDIITDSNGKVIAESPEGYRLSLPEKLRASK